MTEQLNRLDPKYVEEFSYVLQKEGIKHNGIIDYAVSEYLHESRREKKYRHFLGGVLIQGEPFELPPDNPRYKPDLHHKYLLLVDRIGKRVIGGSPVALESTWIEHSQDTIRCCDDLMDFRFNYSMYLLICLGMQGMNTIFPPNLLYDLDEKPHENFNAYDKFIRKLVYLTDLHLELQDSIALDRFVSKYVDTYSSHADGVRVNIARLEQEIDSIFANYPEEFKDVPVSN